MKVNESFTKIENVVVNGKEFVIAVRTDGKIRVWKFVKGKMRLLKVLRLGKRFIGFSPWRNIKWS